MARKKRNEEAEVTDTQPTLADKKEENDQSFTKLTAKNKEYVVRLDRKLQEMGGDEDLRTQTLYHMYPTILQGQKEHIPAKKLYGTPVERAQKIVADPTLASDRDQTAATYERSEWWKLYLDGALLLGGIFALLTGISGVFTPDYQGMSLITLILNFVLGGFAVMVITHYAPQPGQSKGFVKYIVATLLTMVVWILLMGVVLRLVPREWDFMLSNWLVLGIGAVALLLKWYLKKELNIKGTLI